MTRKPDKPHPLIRRLDTKDVDLIYEIEQLAYPFPWSRGVFEDCLRVGYACFGLQIGKVLSGYTIFNGAAGEAHLLNLCRHPDWQGPLRVASDAQSADSYASLNSVLLTLTP